MISILKTTNDTYCAILAIVTIFGWCKYPFELRSQHVTHEAGVVGVQAIVGVAASVYGASARTMSRSCVGVNAAIVGGTLTATGRRLSVGTYFTV
jgi:hypothetical protein